RPRGWCGSRSGPLPRCARGAGAAGAWARASWSERPAPPSFAATSRRSAPSTWAASRGSNSRARFAWRNTVRAHSRAPTRSSAPRWGRGVRRSSDGRDGLRRRPMPGVNFDRAARFYDRTRGLPDGVAADVRDAICTLVGAGPDTRFLEVGVGTGRIALPFALAGRSYWGVDLSGEMLSVLQR